MLNKIKEALFLNSNNPKKERERGYY